MKKFYEVLILIFLIINIKTSDSTSLKDGTVYEIDQNIEGTTEYKTKTVSFQQVIQYIILNMISPQKFLHL